MRSEVTGGSWVAQVIQLAPTWQPTSACLNHPDSDAWLMARRQLCHCQGLHRLRCYLWRWIGFHFELCFESRVHYSTGSSSQRIMSQCSAGCVGFHSAVCSASLKAPSKLLPISPQSWYQIKPSPQLAALMKLRAGREESRDWDHPRRARVDWSCGYSSADCYRQRGAAWFSTSCEPAEVTSLLVWGGFHLPSSSKVTLRFTWLSPHPLWWAAQESSAIRYTAKSARFGCSLRGSASCCCR